MLEISHCEVTVNQLIEVPGREDDEPVRYAVVVLGNGRILSSTTNPARGKSYPVEVADRVRIRHESIVDARKKSASKSSSLLPRRHRGRLRKLVGA